ncbi:MAG: polysaccharide pyruvyl transferase family protein [Planctomycetota bacterium]|jgi:hypothetical protein
MLPEDVLENKKVGIMNLHYSDNFGAVIVPYALSKVVRALGNQPIIVNYIPKKEYLSNKSSVFEGFRKQFLERTGLCKSEYDLRKLNESFSKFIVGSDQVWRWHSSFKYMFNWVSGRKTLISYAASFGVDDFEGTEVERNKAQNLLSRFDAISVREKSGLDICKQTFNMHAEHVLDPTLLLDESDCQEILDSQVAEKAEEKYVAYMFLNEDKIQAIRDKNTLVDLKSNYEFINILKNKSGSYNTVAQWLYYIKNASYLITDSFHGCCFAIIFKKQFVCIKRNFGGNSRIESLIDMLGIDQSRFYDDINDIPRGIFRRTIDYEEVYDNLKREREKSLYFLKNSLSLKPVYKRYCHGEEVPVYLFKKFLLLRIKSRKDKTRVLLFGFIPILKMKHKKNGRIKVYL